MTDITLESLRALIAAVLVLFLFRITLKTQLRHQQGWRYIMLGFAFLLFGMLIDITDNFPELNRFGVIGDTPLQAFLEKVIGELLGFSLVTVGFLKWIPTVNAAIQTRRQLETLNQSLEETVQRRTEALKKLNNKLKDENRQRQQTLNALKESEQRWQFALEGSQNGVWDWNIQSGKCFYSQRYNQILDRGTFPGNHHINDWLELIHPDDRPAYQLAMDEHFAGRQDFFENEHRIHSDKNDYKWILARGKIIEWTEDGEPRRMIGTHADIHTIKQTENALRQTQKMDAIGQLTSGIAHDFNNILNIIIGNLSLLEGRLENHHDAQDEAQEKMAKYLHSIKHASNRAVELTTKLLSYARNQPHNVDTVDINQLITRMHSLIEHSITPEMTVTYTLDEALWQTCINRGDFEDSLINLVFNARDAMQGEGVIRIETRNHHQQVSQSGSHGLFAAGDYVQLSITDTGCGIPETLQDKIFDPFYTTKSHDKGTGLGLAMVYSFVARSKGTIKLTSQPDAPTRFDLFFPRAVKPCSPADAQPG